MPFDCISQNCINVQERWTVKGEAQGIWHLWDVSSMSYTVSQRPTFSLNHKDWNWERLATWDTPALPPPCCLWWAAGVCRGPARDGSAPSYHPRRSTVPLPWSSSPWCLSYHCQIVFHFLCGLSLPLELPLQLSPLLWFHRQDAGFHPVITLLSVPSGCPPSGPLPRAWHFLLSSHNKPGSGSRGELCGERKYLLLETRSLTAGQHEEKGLWIKFAVCKLSFGVGCSIYLSWLSSPVAFT